MTAIRLTFKPYFFVILLATVCSVTTPALCWSGRSGGGGRARGASTGRSGGRSGSGLHRHGHAKMSDLLVSIFFLVCIGIWNFLSAVFGRKMGTANAVAFKGFMVARLLRELEHNDAYKDIPYVLYLIKSDNGAMVWSLVLMNPRFDADQLRQAFDRYAADVRGVTGDIKPGWGNVYVAGPADEPLPTGFLIWFDFTEMTVDYHDEDDECYYPIDNYSPYIHMPQNIDEFSSVKRAIDTGHLKMVSIENLMTGQITDNRFLS